MHILFCSFVVFTTNIFKTLYSGKHTIERWRHYIITDISHDNKTKKRRRFYRKMLQYLNNIGPPQTENNKIQLLLSRVRINSWLVWPEKPHSNGFHLVSKLILVTLIFLTADLDAPESISFPVKILYNLDFIWTLENRYR